MCPPLANPRPRSHFFSFFLGAPRPAPRPARTPTHTHRARALSSFRAFNVSIRPRLAPPKPPRKQNKTKIQPQRNLLKPSTLYKCVCSGEY